MNYQDFIYLLFSKNIFNIPKTLACHCDEYGSVNDSCDETGACTCKADYGGKHCDNCREGMYGFPNCEGILNRNFTFVRDFFHLFVFLFLSKDCNCNVDGSDNPMVCDSAGHCTCKRNVVGYKCDKCAANQYGFPNCQGNIFIHFVQFLMIFQRVIVDHIVKHIYFRM